MNSGLLRIGSYGVQDYSGLLRIGSYGVQDSLGIEDYRAQMNSVFSWN